jgi:DNA polymerase III delta prime subunit
MDSLVESYKKTKKLHHAYFLVGEKETLLEKLNKFIENDLKFEINKNPDYWLNRFNSLNIEEARLIESRAEKKSFKNQSKIFIILADFISLEAQNALLKIIEEPGAETYFFIISPQDTLLPTLRSRMQVLSDAQIQKNKEKILSLPLSKRVILVKEITDAISDEEKTKQDAISFLNQIETEIYMLGTKENFEKLKLCEKTRESLLDRGAPIKIILENLVLSV